ncbi:DHHC palmitoyltransferase-domain-containing protein [Syncephalastrum racemosum]|uniref:Palmitoyltransferase n=1 Tax=Syncephalastrum racemosum TaxID=13706 RepID=A0A1X2HUC7_SYNRA|nr:DHHC palmitoyltransferase-domain-containing protein [Syncephalastrum racemosum]
MTSGTDEHDAHASALIQQQIEQREQSGTPQVFNSLGVATLEDAADMRSSLRATPFTYTSSSILRFAERPQPESLENFDFLANPQPPVDSAETTQEAIDPQSKSHVQIHQEYPHLEQPVQSYEEVIPHSSGLTTLSNITSDDSATLIGMGRRGSKANAMQQTSRANDSSVHLTQHPQPRDHEPSVHSPVATTAVMSNAVTGSTNKHSHRKQRYYQIFPGRNRFFCGGRFMTSREYWAFILALVLLIAPSVLFGIFTCPFIWENIHPVIPILFAYLFVLSLISMIKASWTDPGIIPRDLDLFPAMETYDDQSSAFGSTWHYQVAPMPKHVLIRNDTWTLRYCETCRIYRPPRASHCRQCDNCVETEDHHCIWLNNCIGKRNYRPFFVFISTATLLCLFVIVFSIVQLVWNMRSMGISASFGEVFSSAPVSFVLAIVCFLLLLMVGGLTMYHCSLVLRGVTTHEQLRASIMNSKHPNLGPNPYNRHNPFSNMAHVLCRPRPKSYLRRRKYLDP